MAPIVLIRQETAADVDAARRIQWAAFDQPGLAPDPPVEVALLDALRASDAWIPQLSLVAECDGELVGHVVCTRAHVEDRPVVALGPIGVLPAHQREGIGGLLVHAVVAVAEARGEPLVALLGSTAYYPRFGFRPARELAVDAPDAVWGDHFQARPLTAWSNDLVGPFKYAPPFRDL